MGEDRRSNIAGFPFDERPEREPGQEDVLNERMRELRARSLRRHRDVSEPVTEERVSEEPEPEGPEGPPPAPDERGA